MSAQSLFSKKNIASQQHDSSRGLLEELNLPPGLISFIRKNSRKLQIVLVCAVILVVGWILFDYYSNVQERKGASLLASGLQSESDEQRIQVLQQVIDEFGSTDAARWSKIELAHLEYREANYEAAAAKYKDIIDELSTDNPLQPLIRLSLAQSYEQAGQLDQALAQYNLLKKSIGFADQAYGGLARIQMAKGDLAQARAAYLELLKILEEEQDPFMKSQVEAKLAAIDSNIPASSSQSEENKE